MRLIDEGLTAAQFDALHDDSRDLLRTAVGNDIRQWSRRLADAWAVGDAEEIRRARHALKGLTGAFGADRLFDLADVEEADAARVRALLDCAEETVGAILAGSR